MLNKVLSILLDPPETSKMPRRLSASQRAPRVPAAPGPIPRALSVSLANIAAAATSGAAAASGAAGACAAAVAAAASETAGHLLPAGQAAAQGAPPCRAGFAYERPEATTAQRQTERIKYQTTR